jgi:hypothetical protein
VEDRRDRARRVPDRLNQPCQRLRRRQGSEVGRVKDRNLNRSLHRRFGERSHGLKSSSVSTRQLLPCASSSRLPRAAHRCGLPSTAFMMRSAGRFRPSRSRGSNVRAAPALRENEACRRARTQAQRTHTSTDAGNGSAVRLGSIWPRSRARLRSRLRALPSSRPAAGERSCPYGSTIIPRCAASVRAAVKLTFVAGENLTVGSRVWLRCCCRVKDALFVARRRFGRRQASRRRPADSVRALQTHARTPAKVWPATSSRR